MSPDLAEAERVDTALPLDDEDVEVEATTRGDEMVEAEAAVGIGADGVAPGARVDRCGLEQARYGQSDEVG